MQAPKVTGRSRGPPIPGTCRRIFRENKKIRHQVFNGFGPDAILATGGADPLGVQPEK